MAGLDMSNLGIALGAGVDEWHRQQEELRQEQRAARDDEQFAWQRDQYARQKAAYDRSQQLQSQRDALLKEYADHDAYVAGLDNVPDEQLGEYIKQGITKYNTSPLFKNGYFANATVLNGQPVIVHGDMARKSSEIIPITRKGIKAGAAHMSDMLRRQLAMISPEDWQNYDTQERQTGLERDKIGVQRTTADAAMRNAATQEQYRKDSIEERRLAREEDVTYMQDGPGQIYALRDGKVIATIGRPRPIQGGGGGGVDYSLSPAEQSKFADVLARYNAEQDPAKQAAIAREYQMLQSNALLMRGKVPNLPAAMFKGSTSTVSPELMAKYLTAREALDAMKPKPKIPFYSDTPENAAEIAAWKDRSDRLDAGFAALGLPQEMFTGKVSDLAVRPPVARPKAPPISVQPAAPFSGGGDPRLTGYGLPYTRTTPLK